MERTLGTIRKNEPPSVISTRYTYPMIIRSKPYEKQQQPTISHKIKKAEFKISNTQKNAGKLSICSLKKALISVSISTRLGWVDPTIDRTYASNNMIAAYSVGSRPVVFFSKKLAHPECKICDC